jgi:hypothetical protein
MLITLKSSSDSDAHDFVNFFKENVEIQPNSELALVNCSYNFENGITVDPSVTYTLKLGSASAGTISLIAGSYTRESFLTMLNNTLNTFLTSGPYRRQQAFPSTSSEFVYPSSASDELKLEINYDPQSWATELVSTSASDIRGEIVVDNSFMFRDSGVISKQGNTDVYTDSKYYAGDGSDLNCMWGTAKDTSAAVPHGSYKFRIQQTDAEAVFGLAEGALPANYETDMRIQIKVKTTGQFDILEWNGTALQTILNGDLPYARFDLFEIRLDQVAKTGGSGEHARYFQNGTEITGSNHYSLRPELKLVPLGSFKTGITEKFVNPPTGFALSQCLDTSSLSITAAGSDYKEGELVSITQGASVTILEVSGVNASGGITSLAGVSHGGGILNSTSYTVSSNADGSGATINSGTTVNSLTLSNAGTSYTTGTADLEFAGDTFAGALNIDSVGGSGEILTATLSTDVKNVSMALGDVYNIVKAGGSNGQLTVNAIDQDTNSVSQMSYDTVELVGIDEPLTRHSEATFTPSAEFQSLTDLKFKTTEDATPLAVEGAVSVKNDRETDIFLVNVDQFQIKSICKDGGVQKAIGSLPYGLSQPSFESGVPQKIDGNFIYEPYNLIYQKLSNEHVEVHNQLRVRLTDSVGNPLVQLKHPTTITLDLQPRAK